MAQVSLEHVTKVYPNGFTAVRDLDLEIADGEFMVLVGPSGCGKTTALRMIAGLERLTEGAIRIGGQVVNDMPERERNIAMVFQNYALYPHMSVGDNIGFALKLRRVPKPELRAKVQEAATILGLEDLLDRKLGQLSGGQRQRVAMGRAIVRDPSVFLMDEPLSNLDAKLRAQMRAEVARIQRRLNVATVYVTHDQIEAMTMGDRVAVLRDGVLQQCDRPQAIYDEPANLFVAGFMGSPAMNLFSADVRADARSLMVGSQELRLALGEEHPWPGLSAYAGRRVVLGVRPEHLTLGGEGSAADASASLAADVDLVEALGSETLVHFSLDAAPGPSANGDAPSATAHGVGRVQAHTSIARGERARFLVDPRRLRFFDADTGAAIAVGG